MTKEQLKQMMQSNILIMAGIFEQEQLEDMEEIFGQYIDSGAHLLLAPTYLMEDRAQKEVMLQKCKTVIADQAFLAGAIFPLKEGISLTGGKLSYEDYYEAIKQEASLLKEADVSMLFLLGFDDILEAKCAVFAAKEACDLPLCVGLSFDENLKLKNQTDPVNALVTLQSLDVSGVGYALGENPDDALEVVMAMKDFAAVPLFAFPNVSRFLSPEDFAHYIQPYVNQKCAILGAAKESNEAFVLQGAKEIWQLSPFQPDFEYVNAVTSYNDIVFLDFENNIIGSDKKILEMKLETVQDVENVIQKLIQTPYAPVCFQVTDMDVLIKLMKYYPGRPMIQSDEYGRITAKEYGGLVID